MDFTDLVSPLAPVTKDLLVYMPMVQLQNGYWLAVRQADIALSNAVALYIISIP